MKSHIEQYPVSERRGCNKISHNIQRDLVSGKMQRDLGLEKDTKRGDLETLPEEAVGLFSLSYLNQL